MRHLICCAAILALTVAAVAEDKKDKETPAAEKARKLLKTKISIEAKDTQFRDVIDEIKGEVKGLNFVFDKAVSRNRMITYKAKDKTVEQILGDLCDKVGGIGYFVVSDPKPKASYNGSIMFRPGKERGTEEKK